MTAGQLSSYHSALSIAYQQQVPVSSEGTPVRKIADQIREMICSYLDDALSFDNTDDPVNAYASLAYAHGWMDSALFLGYIAGLSPPLCLVNDSVIPKHRKDQLMEKCMRYKKMLNLAVRSIEIAPESGSPFHDAAKTIRKKTEAEIDNSLQENDRFCASLGSLSYGYGWLDAGIRAGLFRILQHPELFTTETDREL